MLTIIIEKTNIGEKPDHIGENEKREVVVRSTKTTQTAEENYHKKNIRDPRFYIKHMKKI